MKSGSALPLSFAFFLFLCIILATGHVAEHDNEHFGLPDTSRELASLDEIDLQTHKALHAAAVAHAIHKRVQQLSDGRPINLPVIPKSPPVCSAPPSMRFCKSVTYPVYRPSADHTFAELDFDSHAVYKKIVPHMRISEKHFELPIIESCRTNFREFLCLRNFPRCCHVGLCNKYGAPEPVLTASDLLPTDDRPTTVTFVNGSQDTMRVEMGRNDTVKVKMAEAACLEYVKTYTPLFDCRSWCTQLLSKDCLYMLSQDCENLCWGVHSERCASRALYQIATGKESSSPRHPGPLNLSAFILVFAVYWLNAKFFS